MWYVFYAEDSWEHGFVVSSEKEAIEICKDDETGMTVYRYVDAQAEYQKGDCNEVHIDNIRW